MQTRRHGSVVDSPLTPRPGPQEKTDHYLPLCIFEGKQTVNRFLGFHKLPIEAERNNADD